MSENIRPWGKYKVLDSGPGFQVKRIELNPHSRFSLQWHSKRGEKWIIVSGNGLATVGFEEIWVTSGYIVDIGLQDIHRMENIGDEPLVFIEVQLGSYLGEDDITRIEDDYGRS